MDNMKIAVASGSHDNPDNLEKFVAIANHKKCSCLFQGDDFASPTKDPGIC